MFKKQNKTNNDIEKKAFTMDDFVVKKKKKVTQRREKKTKGVREVIHVVIVQRLSVRVCLLVVPVPV